MGSCWGYYFFMGYLVGLLRPRPLLLWSTFLEEREKKRLEQEINRADLKTRRNNLLRETKKALSAGFTLSQIEDWAYESLYSGDFLPAPIKKNCIPIRGTGWKRDESKLEAEHRRSLERYSRLKSVLLGERNEKLLEGRDILGSMLKAGLKPELASLESEEETELQISA